VLHSNYPYTVYYTLLYAGNDNIHLLTTKVRQKLRVDLADFEGIETYAEYNNFLVGSEEEKYALWTVGRYNGTAGQYGVKQTWPWVRFIHGFG